MCARSNAASGEEIIKFLSINLTLSFLCFFHQSFSGDSTPTHKLTEIKKEKQKQIDSNLFNKNLQKRDFNRAANGNAAEWLQSCLFVCVH